MRILDRYLVRSMAGPFAYAFTALVSIFLLQQVAKRFEQLVGKGLPWSVIGEVFALTVPFLVPMALPIAALAATLHATSQLAADNEITAMRAGGVSVGRLLRPLLAVGLLWAATNFFFLDQVVPRTNARLRTLIGDIARVKPTLQLEEQAVNPLRTGLFLRAGRIDQGGGRLRDVTIFDLAGQDVRRVVFADSGVMGMAPEGTDLVLRLYDGEVHEYRGTSATLFQLTEFRENTVLVRGVANELERDEFEGARGDREMSTCEMLDVVATSRGRQEGLEAWSQELVAADLRRLLGLRAGRPVRPSTPERSAGGYCGLLRRVPAILTPRTAEAQAPAQAPQDTGLRMPSRAELEAAKRAWRRGETLPGPSRADSSPAPAWAGTWPAAPLAPIGPRGVALATPAELSDARESALEARRESSEYLLEVHKKWALSAACLVFVLLGVPLALRFPRGGMGLVLGGTGVCVAVFYICLPAGEALADSGRIHPAIPMWAPNFLYAALGLAGLWLVNRESGSTRGGDLAELAAPVRRLASRLRGSREPAR
ncbi:MAG TPA: LptF/LptG family permease [Gemmatimonadales bacterium]|nr:LptF/LptG family permease [Gemmatimonadales bacterium]